MKKLILMATLAILFTSSLYAQDSRWHVDAGVGVAIPTGRFGSKNINDSSASFANTGPLFKVGFDYNLKKHIGLSFLFSGQQNNVDTKTMDNKLEAAFPGNEFHSTSNNWLTWKFMAGINISLPLDKKNKINFTARAMVGVLESSAYRFTQAQKTISNDSLNLGGGPFVVESFRYSRQPVHSAFTYLAGAGMQYNIDKTISFRTNFDYSAASLRFVRTGYANSGGVSAGTGTPNRTIQAYPKQPFASINWCVGAGISL